MRLVLCIGRGTHAHKRRVSMPLQRDVALFFGYGRRITIFKQEYVMKTPLEHCEKSIKAFNFCGG